jgi:stage II sporulation protein B
MNKARITYRFDHQRTAGEPAKPGSPVKEDKVIPLYEEEFQVIEEMKAMPDQVEHLFDTHSLNTFTTDFGHWNSPIESESDRVERVIRETLKESETKRPVQEPMSKQTGEGPEIDPELWSTKRARSVKLSSPPWFRIVASIAGAVITGVAFGFFVLSMFSNSEKAVPVAETSAPKQAVVQGKTESIPQAQADTNSGQNDNPAAGAVSTGDAIPLALPAKSYSFLQNGVFSTLQSAQAAQAELKKKGFASATEQADKVTVFAGFALNPNDALAISQKLKDQKIEVFMKSVDIPALTSIHWQGTKPEAFSSYLSQGDKLVQMLSGLTIVHLAETKPSTLDDSTLQGVRTAYQSLTTLVASMNEGVGSEIKPLLGQMHTALNSSVQSMEAYKKNPSAAMLWQTQSSMMQYILAQKALLKEVSAQ